MKAFSSIHKTFFFIIGFVTIVSFSSCKFLFGDKDDKTVDEIFEQGAIDPTTVPQNVGYVPIQPFFTGFQQPVDVYIGYDELMYVIDNTGLHVLDQTGRAVTGRIAIPDASDVIQDRRLHTYVAGTVERNGFHLAAVYHLINTASGNWQCIDTLIHPDNDESRSNTSFRGADDELVRYTGLATLHDNTLYVSRTGPRNDVASFTRPDNAVLFFDAEGKNIGYASGLSPAAANLHSSMGISSIATFAGPPQRISGIPNERDFGITLKDPSVALEYRVLGIQEIQDPNVGAVYREVQELTNFDTARADRFLYMPGRFKQPEDIYMAPDGTGYIFIVDSGTDSLYQFTNRGLEGVNPPANSGKRKQQIVSFGGTGKGPFQFNDPSGVCYYREMVYVADKGNNRICRYKLSTDLE